MKRTYFFLGVIVLSLGISFFLMIILGILANTAAQVSKSTLGVYLTTLVSPLAIFAGAMLAFRLAFKGIPPVKHKPIMLVLGIPLFILGFIVSFIFPSIVNAALRQVTGGGLGAVTIFNLSIISIVATYFSIYIAYLRQRKKV